jgi:farnesyl diphosphate synthase
MKASILGWTVELVLSTTRKSGGQWQLQAYFLVADDMMDASYTRRGQLCWYKRVFSL